MLQQHQAAGRKVSPADLGREAKQLLASREVRGTLAAIEAAGGRACYLVADVTDAGAVAAAAREAATKLGAITAIVHGAGLLADKRIADKDDSAFERVFRTKVLGFENLMTACAEQPLKQICVFSSVAARYGNPGQCDYAMANEVLNQRAHQLAAQHGNLRVKSLAWGPWRGGMVTEALARHFEAQGVELIDIDAGARAFVAAMQEGPASPTHVVIGGDLSVEPVEAARKTVPFCIDAERHTFLEDHRVQGTVVLPVAYALELMVRAMKQQLPSWHLVSLENVRVLRGVRLTDFGTKPTWFSVEIGDVERAGENGSERMAATLTLHDADGGARYLAKATLASMPAPATRDASPPLDGLAKAAGPVYGGVLFHGPQFQVIDAIEGLDARGGRAALRGGAVTAMDADSAIDVGLVDGALQLALCLTENVLRGPSLPTRVERVEVVRAGAWRGPVRAEIRRRGDESGGMRLECDVTLLDGQDLVVMRLVGVETHLLPASTAVAAPAPSAPSA